MEFQLSFHRYRRPFVNPLRTAHGIWSVREGFIVRIEHDNQVGYGEVAPIPDFGSETLEAAEAFLGDVAGRGELPKKTACLHSVPCCSFGISAACTAIQPAARRDYFVAALLPAGKAALNAVTAKIDQGYTAFKWKIGVEPAFTEQAILMELLKLLPMDVRIRLDANGGLSAEALESWLKCLQFCRSRIDYLEQPLPVGQESLMARYAEFSELPIALDESLHGADGRRWFEAGAWAGPLVIKPALMGDCGTLVEQLRPIASQIVVSSVFETAIGLENTLRIADQLSGLDRAIGFDTLGAFSDNLTTLTAGPAIRASDRASLKPRQIWDSLAGAE